MAQKFSIQATFTPEAWDDIVSFANSKGMSLAELVRAGLSAIGAPVPPARRPGRPPKNLRPVAPAPTPARVRSVTAVPAP